MKKLTLIVVIMFSVARLALGDDVPRYVSAAVSAPERSSDDRERDVRDKPAELMTFAGIAPGEVVADIFGGAGYWSELFARAVGPQGHVDLVNNVGYFNFARDGLRTRFADGRMSEIGLHVVESCDLELGKERVDLAVIFMSYHDLYHVDPASGWPRIDAADFLVQVRASLKPGGHLLIVDHAAKAGTGSSAAQDLHRIDERFTQSDIESHGFVVEQTWDGYRNPGDDLGKLVFDPSVRGKTDRFVHLYRRP
jgi:predicted methyltransferase